MTARIPLFLAAFAACFASFPAFAGAIGGPKFTSTQVLADSSDVFHVSFAGGESATVAISGDGDTDLDLYVYDENGNLVASDLSTSDTAAVSWTPAWSGDFRIEVKNRGSVYNAYSILTD
jgi:hypothetical protein